jgi:hypothetical protein
MFMVLSEVKLFAIGPSIGEVIKPYLLSLMVGQWKAMVVI